MAPYRTCLKAGIVITTLYIAGVVACTDGVWNELIPLPVQLQVGVQARQPTHRVTP